MPIQTNQIHAICFDVDGTLSDTDDLYVEKLARLLQPFHFLFPAREPARMARRLVMEAEAPGNFLLGFMDRIGLDDELFAMLDLMARKNHNRSRETRIVPGVSEMLAQLSGKFPLAVVSARDERTTRTFLDSFNLTHYFTCIATAQTCGHTKPYPDPILWAAQQMKVAPQDCLMVGDTTVDILSGNKAGSYTAGVLCGFGERKELERCQADLILPITTDLLEVF